MRGGEGEEGEEDRGIWFGSFIIKKVSVAKAGQRSVPGRTPGESYVGARTEGRGRARCGRCESGGGVRAMLTKALKRTAFSYKFMQGKK